MCGPAGVRGVCRRRRCPAACGRAARTVCRCHDQLRSCPQVPRLAQSAHSFVSTVCAVVLPGHGVHIVEVGEAPVTSGHSRTAWPLGGRRLPLRTLFSFGLKLCVLHSY